MTTRKGSQTREDILDAFAVEADIGRTTLERYLKLYPEHAGALIDLSYELSSSCVSNGELSADDHARIEQAWRHHVLNAPSIDILASLTADQLRDCARTLDVPRQVVTAFRERAVLPTSVPRKFLTRFAISINTTVEMLWGSLSSPPSPALARSFKADGRPTPTVQVTLERILIEAGVSEDKRSEILSDAD